MIFWAKCLCVGLIGTWIVALLVFVVLETWATYKTMKYWERERRERESKPYDPEAHSRMYP